MKKLFLTLVAALLLTSAAYAAEVSDPVKIAVIDTGISTAAIENDRIAEGYNYVCPGDGTEDKIGHGTAVAGLIVGSPALNVEGVCPEAVLVPLVYSSMNEVGTAVKGDTAMVAQCVYDAVEVYDCKIINISSGATSDSGTLRRAVEYAAERGVLVISCAGNGYDANPGAVYYPGAYESVLCVGSVDSRNAVSSFSQRNSFVDLMAQGENLRILTIKGTRIRGTGTSYSTAVVSGAAAKLWMEHLDWTAAQVRQHLLTTAQIVDGWKILDLDAAMATALPFADVAEGDWFYEAVKYANKNGLFSGTSETTFSPSAPMTRQMLWTVLGRLDGQTLTGSGVFDRAKAWAVEKGITDGSNPTGQITREQLVTILWRYAGYPVLADYPGLAQYSDAGDIASYAQQAMAWAHQKGIISGTSATTLNPTGTATRAQVAAIVMRYAQSAAK